VWLGVLGMLHGSGWLTVVASLACGTVLAVEILASSLMYVLARRKVMHAIGVLDALLEIGRDIARDLDTIAAGRAQPPTRAELVSAMFSTVVLPTLLVVREMGVLSGALVWLVQRSTGLLESVAISALPNAHEPISLDATLEQDRTQDLIIGLEKARTHGIRALRTFTRHVLTPLAVASVLTGAVQLIPLTVTAVGIAVDQRAPSVTATIRSPEALDESGACVQRYEAHDEEGGGTFAFAIARGATLTQEDGTELTIAELAPMPLAGDALWPRTGTWSPTTDSLDTYPYAAPRPPTRLTIQSVPCGDPVTLYGSTDGGVFTPEHAPVGVAGRVAVGLLLLWMVNQFGVLLLLPCMMYVFVQLGLLLWRFEGARSGTGPGPVA
jgi:hypothetical protein